MSSFRILNSNDCKPSRKWGNNKTHRKYYNMHGRSDSTHASLPMYEEDKINPMHPYNAVLVLFVAPNHHNADVTCFVR